MSRPFVSGAAQVGRVALFCFGLTVSVAGIPDRLQAQAPAATLQLSAEERVAKIAERDRLFKEAEQLREQGKDPEAIAIAQQVVAIEEQVFGPEHQELIGTWDFIAGRAEHVENWSAAKSAREKVVQITASRYGQDDWHVTDARLRLDDVNIWAKLNDEQRKKLAEADAQLREFTKLSEAGKYREALALAEKCKETRISILGEMDQHTAEALVWEGYLYNQAGEYKNAEPILQQALKIREKVLGPEHPSTAASLSNLAALYRSQGNYAAAQLPYERALAINEKALGPEHSSTALGLNNLANLYASQGKYAEAEPLLRRALKIKEEVVGPEHPDAAAVLNSLGVLYMSQGKYAAAEPLYQRALKIQEKVLGAEHSDTATSINNLANLYEFQGNYAAAQPLYERAVKIKEKALGVEHPDTAVSLGNLARLYREQGNYTAAGPLLLRALKMKEKAFGPDHPSTAVGLDDLARLYQSQGMYAAAEPLYQRSLRIRQIALGPEHPDVAASVMNLASLYLSQGSLAAAEPLLQQALKINEKSLGPDHSDTARSVNNLAYLYQVQGNYAAAEPLLQRAMKIHEKALGPEHPSTATSLNNLAELYCSQGNYAAAEALHQRALEIREKVLGVEHLDTATSLSNLGILYQTQGSSAAAEPLFARALKIKEKVLGPEHPETVRILNNLAALFADQGNYLAAEPLYRRALEFKEKALGPEHPDTALSLNNLAHLLQSKGDYAAAQPLYERALKIRETALGPDHPDTAISLSNLANLHWISGGSALARQPAGRGLDVRLAHLEQSAAVQTEQQQFLMTTKGSNHLNIWLTVTSDDPNGAGEAWRRVLAWKGLTTTRQIGLRQALKDDPTYAMFQQVSQQLSTVSLNPPLPPSDPKAIPTWNQRAPELRRVWQEQKTKLEDEYQKLEKELARKSALFRHEHERHAVTPKNVVAALREASPATALVDLTTYLHVGRKDKSETSELRVAAFVIRADGKTQRLELGASHSINAELTAWRETYGLFIAKHDPGRELRRVLWEPLEPYLDGIETVLISPDRELAQLPWGALPGARPGTYLIEERSIAVIPVPQMLPEVLRETPRRGPPASLLVAGDIDYGSDPGAPHDLLVQRRAVGRQRDGRWLQFPKLENARSELASIKDGYDQSKAGGKVQTLERLGATEAAFRDDAPRNAWIHLITHGFFAPAELSQRLSEFTTGPLPAERRKATTATPALAGIGAALEVIDGNCRVAQLVAAGAAAKDGRLQIGDEIIAVAPAENDWSDTKGKDLSAIVALIRGPVGTVVRIKVRPKAKPEEQVELPLTRAALPAVAVAKPVPVNPGLLSGLAFAGANNPPESGKDDGILTALEVSALDLSKVDTVVLSACETGLGEVAGGEGLLGLQRSFQVAGAKTVVASLWKVPDAATSELMQRFYENLWDKKMGKLAALREAQLWMLREGVKKPELWRGLNLASPQKLPTDKPADAGISPFYWAAFVLSGDWR